MVQSLLSNCTHQYLQQTCVLNSAHISSILCFNSGYDGTVRLWSLLSNRTHQYLQQTCVLNSVHISSILCFNSGYDGTVRLWSLLSNRTHQYLQQTCVFNSGEDVSREDLNNNLLGLICFNSAGRLLAGAINNMVNIWIIGGQYTRPVGHSRYTIGTQSIVVNQTPV